MADIRITIESNGDLTFLNLDSCQPFKTLGTVTTKRASHIIPRILWKRLAFKTIRMLVSEDSVIARWTRTWKGPWQADMRPVGAPVIDGDWATRQEAIDFEILYLNDWFLRR